jgi:GNAT superfamily N-acetyltransferase
MTIQSPDLSGVEKLAAHHFVKNFKSTEHSLNHWLRRYALANQLADSAQTYVVHRGGAVVGYYSLVYGDFALETCPGPVQNGMPPNYPVPVIKIARLAVDRAEAGRGLGRALMKDAFVRILAAAEIGGLRAVAVNALHEDAKRYYVRNFGFEESPTDPLLLFLRIADLRLASGTPTNATP